MILMLQVFYRWMREQGQTVARYRDECEQLQAETGNFEYKYHQYKRSYIKRATSVSHRHSHLTLPKPRHA